MKTGVRKSFAKLVRESLNLSPEAADLQRKHDVCHAAYKHYTYWPHSEVADDNREFPPETWMLLTAAIIFGKQEILQGIIEELDEKGVQDYASDPDWVKETAELKEMENELRTEHNTTADEIYEGIMNDPYMHDILVARGLK